LHVRAAAAAADSAASAADAAPAVALGDMTWPSRSHGAGSMGEVAVGSSVTLCGWVDKYRNHGGVVFIDLRDHTGFCQVRVWQKPVRIHMPVDE